jgi:carboxymethylenebutenolidase
MIEIVTEIVTRDGMMTTFIVYPERGGPHPPVLFFMDAPGIREELRDMARRLASAGYYVMLPNLYYRSGVMELEPAPPDPASPQRRRMMELMSSIDIPKVMSDTDALMSVIDTDPAALKRPIGVMGYCMSGRYAVNAAARYPDRITAAASLYGVLLMTDAPDSPHLKARETKAELYFACAERDVWAPLDMVERLKIDLTDHAVRAEVEIYPGTEHGFAFPQRAVYEKAAAERHWERLHSLFSRALR